MTLKMTTLPNGLRVMTDTVDSVESVALGAYFGVGTRHEILAENGIAHLVEHMMYKGTPTRSAQQIAEAVEGVGGDMNAYTSREVTGYYFHVLKDHVDLALDVLADMLQHSTLEESEMERERQVILQEIGMVTDTPDDLVFDHYQQTAYAGQSLGAPILGTAEIVANMPRPAILAYIKRLYTPKNLVISAAGNVQHDAFVARVQSLFTDLPADQETALPLANYRGGECRTEKELEQAHILFGFRGIGRHDDRYYDAVALAHVLGHGMSSRLFQEIREKRGLVYNIYAFHATHHEDGQFAVYAGTGPERLDELMNVLTDELCRVADTLTPEEILRTQVQLKSSLLMGRESMTSRADQNAKFQLFYDRMLDTADLRRRIEATSVDSVRAMARQIFAGAPTLAAIGPIGKLQSLDTLARKMASA